MERVQGKKHLFSLAAIQTRKTFMPQFIVMELSDDHTRLGQSKSVQIVNYEHSLHHDQIPQIYAEAFDDAPWPDNWDDIEEFDPNGMFLATDGNRSKLAGFVICFKRRHFGYISVVAVRPGFRRKGIATALILEAIRYLHSLGLSKIQIRVDVTNTPAIQVYKKLGFEIMSESDEGGTSSDSKLTEL